MRASKKKMRNFGVARKRTSHVTLYVKATHSALVLTAGPEDGSNCSVQDSILPSAEILWS